MFDQPTKPTTGQVPHVTGMVNSQTLGTPWRVASATSDMLTHPGIPQQGSKSSRSTAVSPKDRPTSLKRRRSSDDDEEEHESRVVVQDESNTFYIDDFEKVGRFMLQRLEELNLRLLQGIVANWIRLLEPRRLKVYGNYHNKLPSQMPEDATPPWWPKTVMYKKPSHLKKEGTSLMRTGRRID
jgi:hypothetical protein